MRISRINGVTKSRTGKGFIFSALMLLAFKAPAQSALPLPDADSPPPGLPTAPYNSVAPYWSPTAPPVPNAIVGFAQNAVAGLSTLPAAVGHTPASFAVSKLGTADYSIPISTPPGVGDTQLKLALSYTSRGPNGLEGMGWSITGLSSISRCNRTYAQDGAPGPVLLQQTDRLCLDGKQLKLTSGAAPNFVLAGNQYATEIETFSQITANGSGALVTSFTVQAKDGVVYTYGGTADSEIIAGSSGVIRIWALSKIADHVGNNIQLVYQNDTVGGDPTNGSYRIDHINYPYLAGGQGPYYKVNFTYGGRPATDIISSYLSGYLIQESHQLNTIGISETAGTLIKSYGLTYTTGATSGRQTLTSVQECSASTCFPPTVVAYQPGATDWTKSTAMPLPAGIKPRATVFVDLNGDGKLDVLYDGFAVLSTPSGYTAPIPVPGLGLGRPNTSMVGTFAGNSLYQVITQSGSNLIRTLTQYDGVGGVTNTLLANAPTPTTGVFALDVDGDGLTDLAYISCCVQPAILVQRNITVPPGPVSFAPPVQIYITTGTDFIGGKVTTRQVDLNGDGRADLLTKISNNSGYSAWQPLLSNGVNSAGVIQAFTVMPRIADDCTPGLSCTFQEVTLDWNGDGCTDFLQPLHLNISNCAGGFVSYALPAVMNSSYGKIGIDFNGDGREDFVYTTQNSSGYPGPAFVLVSNGGNPAFATSISTAPQFNSADSSESPEDVNGDGLADYVFSNIDVNSPLPHTSFYSYYEHNGAGQIPDLATSFTDGFGLNQSPTYVPVTNSSYYGRSANAVYPEVDYQGALYVVSQFTASDGAGSTYQNRFNYFGARTNAQGRGFEGFYSKATYDTRNSLYTWDYYRQTFPYTGMIIQRSVNNGADSNNNLSQYTATPNSEALIGLGGFETRWFTYLSPETTVSRETVGPKDAALIATKTKTTTYGDGYGNPTNVVTNTIDNDVTAPTSPFNGQTWSSTVTTQYNIDTANWCLNLPQTSAVTHAVPGQITQTRNTSYTVDGLHCRVSQKIAQPSPSPLTVTTDYGYDTCGGNVNSVAVTGHNPDGTAMAVRTNSYNYGYSTGRCQLPEQITNALNQSSIVSYNYDFGVPLSSKDPNNLTTAWLLDDYGRKARETRPDGTYTTWSFGACNASNNYCGVASLRYSLAKYDYAVGGAQINYAADYYDGLNRLQYHEQQRVLGTWTIEQTHTYDSLGRMTYDYAPYSGAINGYTVWTYDVLNRPKSRTLYTSSGAVDRSTTFGYLGRTTTTTDPLVPSNVTQRITDVSGRLRQVIDPSPGGTTQYIFDAFGNLNKTIDAKGIVSSASYNLRGFRTQMMDADAGTWNFVPDSLNELVSWTDAKGQSFSAVFDPLGRITSKTEPEGTNIWTWGNSAAAFNIGQLASISGYGYAGHPYSEILTYDSLSRLGNRSITTDQNYQFNYTYNTIGEMATLAYPASPIPAGTGPRYTIQYQYSYGFPFQIQDVTNATAPATIWALGSANDYSSPLTETLGTGVGATIVTSTYKPWTNQVLSIQAGVGGSLTNRQNLAYLWDVDDNLTQRRDLNQILTENFVPDALNRLSSSTLNGASNLSVGYDAAGDITSRSDVGTYSYGNAAHPHGVTAAGSSTYTYDANGNVATRNGLANTWTSYNLPSVLQASVSGVTLKTTLVYGPEHERVGQQAFELNGTELTSYVGGILEKMGASTTQLLYWRHYVNTPTGRTIIVSRNSDLSTSTSLVLSDHLGSSDAIINGVTGALNVQESFSPFGLRRQSNWAAGIPTYWDQVAITENTRHGFTGHDQLDNVGLIHMNGRVYDPVVGRFMSVDPDPGEPGNSQRLNPYSYVSNRPLVATDPTGFADSTVFNDVIAGSQGGGQGAGGHDSTEDHRTDIRIIDNSTQNDTSGPGNVQNKSAQPSTQPTAPVAATVAAATAEGTLQEIVVSGLRRVVIAAATEAAVVAAVATTVVAMLSISGDTHVDTSGHNDKPKSPPPPAPTGTSQSTPADPNGQGDDENNKKEQDKKTTDQQPNLRRIHSDETLNSGSNKFNLESLRKQTTEKIVESLKPGQPEALKVKPDGSIFDGNTRIKILQERGFDVNSLPREIMK